MGDWTKDKNLGPWEFYPQHNKWGYLNNPRWQTISRKFVFGGPDDYTGRESEEPQIWTPLERNSFSTGSSVLHNPCGHWHRPTPATGIPTTSVPEDIYTIQGWPLGGGRAGEGDRCYRLTKDLTEVTWYGGKGSGIDQLQCPVGITVDSEYVYICDRNNNRVMKRLKDDLSYVHHRALSCFCCHTNGSVLWVGNAGSFYELNLTTLATIRTLPAGSYSTRPYAIYDISSDDNYLYISDVYGRRVMILNISDFSFVAEFGRHSKMFYGATGVWHDGGSNIYAYDYGQSRHKLYKITEATWTITMTASWVYAPVIFGYGTYLYCVDDADDEIQVRNLSDFALVDTMTADLSYPGDVWVDGTYIYVTNDYYIAAFDIATRLLVMENGDRTGVIKSGNNGYDEPCGITGDATYIYIVDSWNNRIVKRDKSDLTYVGEYADPVYAVFWRPLFIDCDDTYLYVSDNSKNYIVRINKATMTYVDNFGNADLDVPTQVSAANGYLYVGNSNKGICKFDLSTLTLDDESPEQDPASDPDFWMDDQSGIAVDDDYIYLGNNPSALVGEIKIFDKSTYDFVASFNATRRVEIIAVDDSHIYVSVWNTTDNLSYYEKYDKVSYAFVNRIIGDYCASVDVWRTP